MIEQFYFVQSDTDSDTKHDSPLKGFMYFI